MCKYNTYSYLVLDGQLTSIDRCIAPLILQLNLSGIKTIQSCCGHGEAHISITCAKGTKQKLNEFGCKIAIIREDGLVEALFIREGLDSEALLGSR